MLALAILTVCAAWGMEYLNMPLMCAFSFALGEFYTNAEAGIHTKIELRLFSFISS